MSDKILHTAQAHLIASSDFKPLDEGEGTSVSTSGNGNLIALRAALRSLAIEVVSANIKKYQDVGSASGTILGRPGVDIYSEQLGELRRVYGDEIDGNASSEPGTISYDISALNEILKGLERGVDFADFAHVQNEEINDSQSAMFSLENDTILANEPTDAFYVDIKTPSSGYPGVFRSYLASYMKFPPGSPETFSSTKVFISLLQGIGFAASRFLPMLCTDNELVGRSAEEEDGSIYTIRPNPELEFDLLRRLSFGKINDPISNSKTPIRYLFHTTATTADGWYNTVSNQIFNGFPDNPALPDFFESENDLARLIMLISRELSNSAALAKYQSDDYTETRSMLEAGGLEIDENHAFTQTFYRNTTNLINNNENVSPFESLLFEPATVTITGVTTSDTSVSPTPQKFVTLDLDNSGFPGQSSETTRCSLFEPHNMLIDDDVHIAGVRDFLVGGLFDLDEVSEARALNTTFGENSELSRLTTVQKSFNSSMTTYRDFVKTMTALGEPDREVSTHPRAVARRLFCSNNLESLLNMMTQTVTILEETPPDTGGGGGSPPGDGPSPGGDIDIPPFPEFGRFILDESDDNGTLGDSDSGLDTSFISTQPDLD